LASGSPRRTPPARPGSEHDDDDDDDESGDGDRAGVHGVSGPVGINWRPYSVSLAVSPERSSPVQDAVEHALPLAHPDAHVAPSRHVRAGLSADPLAELIVENQPLAVTPLLRRTKTPRRPGG
jgi:hypothetical protein